MNHWPSCKYSEVSEVKEGCIKLLFIHPFTQAIHTFSLFLSRTGGKELLLFMGNCINTSAVKDLHYKGYLKTLSKLNGPLEKCNLKGFSDITSNVNP